MNYGVLLVLAKRHAPQAAMRSSAELCVKDAETLFNKGERLHAIDRLFGSLRYSLGILHPVYRQLLAELQEEQFIAENAHTDLED